MFLRRIANHERPWTDDPILIRYRFTNVYRAADRVSQYLIRSVIYRPDLPDEPREILFRTILFKLFNKIETWEMLEESLGPLTLDSFSRRAAAELLAQAIGAGRSIYSAAYIMPSTGCLGESVKHRGHLRLVEQMTAPEAVSKIIGAATLGDLFEILIAFPTLGPFLAFQLAIDLNYSPVMNHSEMEFVVAGPGAKDGLRKCFHSFGDYTEQDVIRWVAERQHSDPEARGLTFPNLFGRALQLIDVQNLFCEISKYARVAHPDIVGLSGRTRIKQTFQPSGPPLPLFFPPKWRLNECITRHTTSDKVRQPQRSQPALGVH